MITDQPILADLQTIKAIETRYAGCRFRSRLEARWAVFFDSIGIEWQYEPQGYALTLPNGVTRGYLPDFWLPELDVWAEVKGVLDEKSLETLIIAASAAGVGASPTADNFGSDTDYPWRGRILVLGTVPSAGTSPTHYQITMMGDSLITAQMVFFARFKEVGWRLVWFDTPTTLNEYLCGVEPTERFLDNIANGRDVPVLALQEKLVDAYGAARRARFEHGESS